MEKMNYYLMSFGLMVIILGLIVTYVATGLFLRVTSNFEDFSKQITGAIILKKNELFVKSLPGLVIVALGVLIIRLGFRR